MLNTTSTNNISGLRSGRLVALHTSASPMLWNSSWVCQCDCGSTSLVIAGNLKSGGTKSCGCILKEKLTARNSTGRKHGLSKTSIYRTWKGMLSRCYNKNSEAYQNYGGRGITVCDEWLAIENFLADMGQRPSEHHSIERLDNNVGYSKQNCVWATDVEQNRNRRNTVYVVLDGVEMTMREASDITLINYATMRARHYKGKTTEALGLFKGRCDR